MRGGQMELRAGTASPFRVSPGLAALPSFSVATSVLKLLALYLTFQWPGLAPALVGTGSCLRLRHPPPRNCEYRSTSSICKRSQYFGRFRPLEEVFDRIRSTASEGARTVREVRRTATAILVYGRPARARGCG
jgi:hypothetical protein